MSTELSIVMASGMLTAGVHTVSAFSSEHLNTPQVITHSLLQTSSQSTFLLHEMAKNPEAQQRLYEEIQAVVGDRAPTAHDIATLSYLNGCIKESFRLVPLLLRITSNDSQLLYIVVY